MDRCKAPVLLERERANKIKDDMERRMKEMQEQLLGMQMELQKLRADKEAAAAVSVVNSTSNTSLGSDEAPVRAEMPTADVVDPNWSLSVLVDETDQYANIPTTL